MLFGFAHFVILMLNLFLYLLMSNSTYQYVKGELYIYENHSTKRHEFTPKIRRRLRIILIIGFIPILQYLLILVLVWLGLRKMYRTTVQTAKDLTVMWRKLTEGKP